MKDKSIIQENISMKERYLLMLILFLPCFLINRALNNDIWFLLNHGRYVFEYGFPHIEPFTIHQGFEFVMQQWLSACIFWITYLNFGAMGLNALVIFFYILIVYFLFKLCMRVSSDNFFISFTFTLFASILLVFFMVHRPYIFSLFIIVLELYFLESYILSKKRSYLYILPLLSLLLINLHAAMWPIIFIIMIPYLIDSYSFKFGPIQAHGYDSKLLYKVILMMLVIAFINPYGLKAMTYVFRSYGYVEINSMVNEMMPVNINTLLGVLFYSSMLVVVFIYSLYRKGTTRLRYILLTLGISYMALSSVRNFSLFAVCALFPLAYYLRDFYFPINERESTRKTLLIRKVLVFLIIGLFIFAMSFVNSPTHFYKEYGLLDSAVDYMMENKDPSKILLYTGYNDGGLPEFRGVPSYIDPRAEVFVKRNNKKEDIMEEYFLLQKGKLYYKDFLDKYDFTDLIITENDILYINLKNDPDYRVWYTNKKYFIFEKKKK